MKYIIFSLIFLVSVFSSINCFSADILVNSSGLPGSYLKLSDAVNAASAGDRLLVASQTFPYQEDNDTLFIDKDLTILPYGENTFIDFAGNIMLTLDNINEFTLIGVRSTNNSVEIFSNIIDTLTNQYSIINVIDCKIRNIRLDQPKTSLYLSYSDIDYLAFSHGNIIGNKINFLFFGIYDYGYNGVSGATSSAGSVLQAIAINNPNYGNQIFGEEPHFFWPNYSYQYSFGDWPMTASNSVNRQSPLNSTNSSLVVEFITECELFENAIPFGNANVYSDTCLVIANYFTQDWDHYVCNLFSLDFPIHFFNNKGLESRINLFLTCPTSKGTNRFINNERLNLFFYPSYCTSDSSYNFRDVNFDIQNNQEMYYNQFLQPNLNGYANYNSLTTLNKGIMAYNSGNYFYGYNEAEGLDTTLLLYGPGYNSTNNTGSPDYSFLNLDLSQNIIGRLGGSHSWENYHSNSGYSEAGNMPSGSKSRITYLNLPTQIFNPSNLRIKAKSVHGNTED